MSDIKTLITQSVSLFQALKITISWNMCLFFVCDFYHPGSIPAQTVLSGPILRNIVHRGAHTAKRL